ncbi:MAG: dihydrolipoamide acetyltransferase family protein [Hydrotalea sp.]|nr:dihydrolipoamide acetyltransferase family protein [Hydrotalea sp.]
MNNQPRIFISPLAKRMAAERGVVINSITGSGPHGRIVKADIEKLGSGGQATNGAVNGAMMPQTATIKLDKNFEPPFTLDPLTAMRRVIAERLTLSKTTVPHFYLTIDCDLSRVSALRKKWQEIDNIKVSINDVIIKALAMACQKVPAANASFTKDGIKMFQSVDVAVAVAIDGGLITPIVRQASRKSLQTISAEMKTLASKAKEGKLKPEEYQGGTISLSNLGMFGIKQFDAVINPPQGAILAVGAGVETPVVRDGRITVAPIMTATLSCDHRVVDGAIGANLLKYFKLYIEDPALMFFS